MKRHRGNSISLSEGNLTEKATCCIILTIWHSEKRNDRDNKMICQQLGKGGLNRQNMEEF